MIKQTPSNESDRSLFITLFIHYLQGISFPLIILAQLFCCDYSNIFSLFYHFPQSHFSLSSSDFTSPSIIDANSLFCLSKSSIVTPSLITNSQLIVSISRRITLQRFPVLLFECFHHLSCAGNAPNSVYYRSPLLCLGLLQNIPRQRSRLPSFG